jgi:hypothetical protein
MKSQYSHGVPADATQEARVHGRPWKARVKPASAFLRQAARIDRMDRKEQADTEILRDPVNFAME